MNHDEQCFLHSSSQKRTRNVRIMNKKLHSLVDAGFVLGNEDMSVTRYLHIHVPVQAKANGPAGEACAQRRDARQKHRSRFLAAEAPAHALCSAHNLPGETKFRARHSPVKKRLNSSFSTHVLGYSEPVLDSLDRVFRGLADRNFEKLKTGLVSVSRVVWALVRKESGLVVVFEWIFPENW